jgi:hypothetical protein
VLTPEAYDALLRSADAVVIPYEPADYRVRTSAVFCESVAAGKAVLAPAGTWMHEQMTAMEGGGIAFAPYEAPALAAAISEVAASPDRYRSPPAKARGWCEANSAAALVAALGGLVATDQAWRIPSATRSA